ncbi:peptide chain release factor N(5)-glutamine methyltransferase [Sulfurospirillum sp. 1307]
MYSIKDALIKAVDILKDSSEIPQKEARILLAHHLKKDQIFLITNEDKKIVDEKYFELIQKRANHEPVEYITNSAMFYSREFYVDSRVLIPRPETELLVDLVVSTCKGLKRAKIVEIGTGSGIISIMLAILLPKAKIKAIDISNDALDVAKINAKKHGVEDKIEFIQSNLLENVKDNSFDMLVSNPPYIANDESLHVGLSYEPSLALYGGEVGDEILKDIIDTFKQRDIKYLACEMGYDQREKILSYANNAEFYKDLAGLDRGFIIRRD